MKLTDIRPAKGAVRRRKRLGTGTGSGRGGTCGRGTKGTGSRSGGSMSRHFEGGQLPIHRRLPKVGFTPRNRTVYQLVNVADLSAFDAGSEVTPELMVERGLVRKAGAPIKLLANGEIQVGLVVRVDAASAAARRKIEGAGGRVEGRG
jgi:large subunit ribosomal protein L15